MRKPLERREKSIRTQENWYPTVNGCVKVMFFELNMRPRLWRVCIWGGDDFGLESDLKSRMQALDLFEKIKDFTTQTTLRSWGFHPA